MKTPMLALLGATALATSANATFDGFTAFARAVNGSTLVDVYAVTSTANHRLFNVYDSVISTSAIGGFYQASGVANKTWKPDLSSFTSTRDSIDSFMTIGASRYAGDPTVYAGITTAGDPNFTGTSWSATPASAPAVTVPNLAGWYSADPTDASLLAENISGLTGLRVGTAGNFGVWVGHLVLGTVSTQTISWQASATTKDLTTNVTQQLNYTRSFVVPAPGAATLVGIAGLGRRSRRRG
jgi:hypothetical protein